MVYDKEKKKAYRQIPEVKAMVKEYNQRPDVKEKKKARDREYYWKNREKRLLYNKKYRENNKSKINKTKEKYRENNKKIIIKSNLRYYKQNKKKINNHNKKYSKKRYKEDPLFNLKLKLRRRLSLALTNYSKEGKIQSASKYGINYKKIIEHLKPFPKDIENYHVDHIIPLSYFDFNNPEEIKWAFSPENHQWLTKEQNLAKGNRFIGK